MDDFDKDVVCYDTETSGRDTRHGQIFEFAGLKADMNLQPVRDLHLRIRRLPYVVPEPEALAVTRVDPESLDALDRPTEFDAATKIDAFLRPERDRTRLFITFNGIQFDDEFLRVMLMRNLRDPYFSAGRNCYRLDVLDLVRFAHSGDPDCVVLPPLSEDGKQTWKLEALCNANAIPIEAHGALSDTHATLALARLIRERARWAWDVAVAMGTANAADRFMREARDDGRVIFRHSHFGQADLAPCVVLGGDQRRWLVADLRRDPADIVAAIIAGEVYGKDTPISIVKANKSPYIMSEKHLPAGLAVTDMDVLKATGAAILDTVKARRLDLDPAFSFIEKECVTSEERIYSGFVSRDDKDRMRAFCSARTWSGQTAVRFEDHRLRDFQARLLCMTAPDDRPESLLAPFRVLAADAFARPFRIGDQPFITLERVASEADDAYRLWASKAYAADVGPDDPSPDDPHPIEADIELAGHDDSLITDPTPTPPQVAGKRPGNQLTFGF